MVTKRTKISRAILEFAKRKLPAGQLKKLLTIEWKNHKGETEKIYDKALQFQNKAMLLQLDKYDKVAGVVRPKKVANNFEPDKVIF